MSFLPSLSLCLSVFRALSFLLPLSLSPSQPLSHPPLLPQPSTGIKEPKLNFCTLSRQLELPIPFQQSEGLMDTQSCE